MTEVTYTVPVIGEKNTVACPLVDTAFTELKTVINGKIGPINFETNALTGEKVNKEIPKVVGTYTAVATITEAKLEEPSATRPTFVILEVIFSGTETSAAEFIVGGKQIAVMKSVKPAEASEPHYNVSFWVPAGAKWEWKKTAGSVEVKARWLIC